MSAASPFPETEARVVQPLPFAMVFLDLKFDDNELEEEFRWAHNEGQIINDVALAAGIRFPGWLSTCFKAWLRGDRQLAPMLLTAFPSGGLPLVGMGLGGLRRYVGYRELLVAVANGLQFYFLGKYYGQLYPCAEGNVTRWQMLAAAVSGNGALFLILTSTMGSLLFRWLFITQYAFFMLLALNNVDICEQSPALRAAYGRFHGLVMVPILRRMLAPISQLSATSSLSNAISSWQLQDIPREGLGLCVPYQLLVQLVLGFWLPCWAAYARELQARHAFLAGRRKFHPSSMPSVWDFWIYSLPVVCFTLMLAAILPEARA